MESTFLDFTIVLVLWDREFYCWKGCHVLFCGLNCVCSNSHELQITCNKKTMPFEGNVYISQRVLSRPLVDCCDRSFYSAIYRSQPVAYHRSLSRGLSHADPLFCHHRPWCLAVVACRHRSLSVTTCACCFLSVVACRHVTTGHCQSHRSLRRTRLLSASTGYGFYRLVARLSEMLAL
jgi:hypothetical protein